MKKNLSEKLLVFQKHNHLFVYGTLALSLSCFTGKTQNASHDQNAIPINGNNCTGYGSGALQNNSPADSYNTALGWQSLNSNNGGNNNTAGGAEALLNNITGSNNTAVGRAAMFSNKSGSQNIAIGHSSLHNNTTGYRNVGIGAIALYSCTTGYENVGVGHNALASISTGYANVGIGFNALWTITTGYKNVGIGDIALTNITTGRLNTAVGSQCLGGTTTGEQNTACGVQALRQNKTGNYNSAHGLMALDSHTMGDYNSSYGYNSLLTDRIGDSNTGLGAYCDVSANNLINATALGALAIVDASDKVRIGNTAVTVIEGEVPYSTPSDARFKTNVREQDVKGLEFIMKLRPVVYNFDTKKFTEFLTKNMDEEHKQHYLNKDFKASTATRQSGFIAQEVEKAAAEVGYDFNGVHTPDNDNDNYSIAYSQFVIPLVKGMQQQQAQLEAQNKAIEQLKQELEQQKQSNEALQDKLAVSTGVNQLSTAAEGYGLEQNEPNPFTRETVINYQLPQTTNKAYLAVFDLSGKQIATFNVSQMGSGSLTITSEKLSAGIYLYSMVADGKALGTKRMMVADK